ncbi:MAG: UDP-N-acetylmuramate dehydrogenase [Prevotella sp.]|nr:UDP-N-acetylmuramate dehydrogenase [Prevotella sp.]MDY4217770.1 UDP-N-acetylmuramate dehydrogenase [Prevotella sp.]
MRDIQNYNLLHHNTFGINATCRRFIEYATTEEAQQVAQILSASNDPFLIIGGGSNLLLTGDYEGIVVRSAIQYIAQIDEIRVRCGSGYEWDKFIDFCLSKQLYGAENLSLIPGDVGASAVQNIGAYGAEVQELIEEIEAVEIHSGKIQILKNAECAYAYRQSRFKNEWKNRYLITHVTFRLSKTFTPKLDYGNITTRLVQQGIAQPTAEELRQTIINIRNEKLPDPKTLGNAGSFFMNPIVDIEKYAELAAQYSNMPHYVVNEKQMKIPAGWLIEQCGWKGRRMGEAGVYEKQSLVLVNYGQATGQDIVRLCKAIQADVIQKFGIDIHPEVNII